MLRSSSAPWRLLGGAAAVAVTGLVLAGAAVPASAATGKPPAPTSVKGVGDYSTSVKITWKSGKGSTKGFNVYRGTTAKVSITKSNRVNSKLLTSTWIRSGGLLGNKTYWFVVQAVGSNSKTTNAKAIAVKTKPTPPTAATLVGTPGDQKVTLNWTAGTKGGKVDGWSVYRTTLASGDVVKNGALVTKTRLPATARSYVNASRTNGTVYRYVVVAINGGGSVKSNTIAVRAGVPKPGAPTLTTTRTSTYVDLAWTPTGPAATSWKVYRSTTLPVSTSGTPLATITNAATTSLRDNPVGPLATFHYVVVATNQGGSTVSNTVTSAPGAPHAPTASATAGDGEVDLSWTAAGTGGPVETWKVYRSTTATVDSSASATPVASLPVGTTTYEDDAVTNGTTYRYVVVATNGGGRAASAVASATPQVAPPAAPVLTGTNGDGQVNLSIAAGSGGGPVASLSLYRSTSSTGVVNAANLVEGALTPSSTSYLDTDVVNGTTYYYVVVATNAAGSISSNQISRTPAVPTPAALVVSNPAAVAGSAPFVMSRMTYCLSTTVTGACQVAAPNGLVRAPNPDAANALTWFRSHDLATIRLTNTGGLPATVTGATIDASSQANSFSVETVPTTIPAGESRDVTVRFVFIGNATFGSVLRTGSLTVTATGLPDITVPLTGQWQPGPNRSTDGSNVNFEPSVAQVVNGVYGLTTNIGGDGLLDNNRGDQALGDETLSRFWTQADGNQPVTVQRLAAYSSSGLSKIAWYDADTIAKSISGCSNQFGQVCHGVAAEDNPSGSTVNNASPGQTVLPDGDTVHSFVPDSTRFGLVVGTEFSDNERNNATNDVTLHGCTSPCGHHMRFYPVKDAGGLTVPNAYVVVVDLNAVNNDFNDDILLVTNIAPITAPVS